MRTLLIASLVCSTALLGCSKEKPNGDPAPTDSSPGAGPKAATPQAAVKNMWIGDREGDKDLFMGSWAASPEQFKMLEILFETQKAQNEFRHKFIKTYGEKAWRDFMKGGFPCGNDDADYERAIAKVDKLQFKISGDKAEMTDPEYPQNRPEVVVKSGDQWKVDYATSGWRCNEAALKEIQGYGAIFRKYIAAIGRKGISAEDIKVEVGRALAATDSELPKVDGPRRFDIDHLPAD